PPPDDSGGGGAQPQPGNGAGDNAPKPGTRVPSDPPPEPSTTGTGNGSSTTNTQYPFGPVPVASVPGVWPFRGVNDTLGTGGAPGLMHVSLSAGDKDALLLPCFRILRKDPETGQRIGGYPAGSLDVVTLSTGLEVPRREQRRVRWAHAVPGGGRSTS